jgi:hypothetical protein
MDEIILESVYDALKAFLERIENLDARVRELELVRELATEQSE